MNVFELRNQLVNDYKTYVSSFIQIRDSRIREHVDEQLKSGLLWPEPLIQLNPAFQPAYYARLYGLTRDELRYILDPKEVHGEDFPGETFRVLKEKEIRLHGEYRTRRLVLEAWDRLSKAETTATN